MSKTINSNLCKYLYTIICIMLILLIIWVLIGKMSRKVNNFEDITTTTFPMDISSLDSGNVNISSETNINQRLYPNEEQPLTMDKVEDTSCERSDNFHSVCMNYDNCCKTNRINTECMCNNPILVGCKTKYSECIDKETKMAKENIIQERKKSGIISDIDINNIKVDMNEIKNICIARKKDCCNTYNSIPIMQDKFQYLGNYDQKYDKLCNLSMVNNLEQKCMELCATNPECKSYSISDLMCVLFKKSRYDSQRNINSRSNAKYYLKK